MTSHDEHNDHIPWYIRVVYAMIWLCVVPVLVVIDNLKHLKRKR